eukprot:929084_1
MQSELPLSLNRQQTVKISEPSSKRQNSSSVNSEYLSFCVEHMKATSMESDDADIYSTSKSQTLVAMRNVYTLSSSMVTRKSRRVSLDSNETDNDDKRYKGIVPPISLSSIISCFRLTRHARYTSDTSVLPSSRSTSRVHLHTHCRWNPFKW